MESERNGEIRRGLRHNTEDFHMFFSFSTLKGRLHLGTGQSPLRRFLPFISMQLELVRVAKLSSACILFFANWLQPLKLLENCLFTWHEPAKSSVYMHLLRSVSISFYVCNFQDTYIYIYIIDMESEREGEVYVTIQKTCIRSSVVLL